MDRGSFPAKAELSTLPEIGTFYFALTATGENGDMDISLVEQRSILTICLTAAFADGVKSDPEREQIRKIAETKMKDLNANSIEAAMQIILGSAKSCGIEVKG